jgi:hypothetical protein
VPLPVDGPVKAPLWFAEHVGGGDHQSTIGHHQIDDVC